jgi:hypothetical protein
VPFVLSVSARDPASIQTPTVDVCAHGECSVAIYTRQQWLRCGAKEGHTVKPFDSVVDSVVTPFFTTGVAKPLRSGATALRPARPRRPCERFKANRRDAMGAVGEVGKNRLILNWKGSSWNLGIQGRLEKWSEAVFISQSERR